MAIEKARTNHDKVVYNIRHHIPDNIIVSDSWVRVTKHRPSSCVSEDKEVTFVLPWRALG